MSSAPQIALLWLTCITTASAWPEAMEQAFQQRCTTAETFATVQPGPAQDTDDSATTCLDLLRRFDLATTPAERAQARTALDHFCATSALHYYRGRFARPGYGLHQPQPFSQSITRILWLWFGDSPTAPTRFNPELLHRLRTSAYRPPEVAVHLAHKRFGKPMELIANQPFSTPTPQATYFGEFCQMTTLLPGATERNPGLTLLTWSSRRGADLFVAGCDSEPLNLLQPPHTHDGMLVQNGNLAAWLLPQRDEPFLLLAPKQAQVFEHEGVTLIKTELVTIALWPVNAAPMHFDQDLTRHVQFERKFYRDTDLYDDLPRWDGVQVLRSNRLDDGPFGFVLELHEGPDLQFQEKARHHDPDLSEWFRHTLRFKGIGGRRLKLAFETDPANRRVWADGIEIDFRTPERQAAYHTLGVFGRRTDPQAIDLHPEHHLFEPGAQLPLGLLPTPFVEQRNHTFEAHAGGQRLELNLPP